MAKTVFKHYRRLRSGWVCATSAVARLKTGLPPREMEVIGGGSRRPDGEAARMAYLAISCASQHFSEMTPIIE